MGGGGGGILHRQLLMSYGVSKKAIERQVTSEIEGTLLQYNTPIERQVLYTEQ